MGEVSGRRRSLLIGDAVLQAEFAIGSIYLPPFLLAVSFGFLIAYSAARLITKFGWEQWFWHPGLAFLAWWALCTAVLGMTVLPP